MFKKLLSNLPFNPSLIHQVSFYTQRMKQESKIRRTAFIFMALTMVVQFFAVISPPQPTLASSGNDIIPGGFSSKTSAVTYCNQNSYDFRVILQRFGITCADLSASATQTIRSTDYNRKLLSLGRIAYGKAGERPQVINGTTYYQRYLWSWDTGAYSSYTALVGRTATGAPFMVLYNCGNVTVVESAPAPPPPPLVAPPPPAPTNRRPAMNFTANCAAVSWSASDADGMPRVRIYITTSTVNSDTDWNNKGPFVHSVTPTGSGINNGSWSIPSQYRNTTTRYRVFAVVSDKLPSGAMDDTNYVRASPVTGVLFGPCTQTPPPPPLPPTPPPVTPPPPTDVCPDIIGTQTNTSECKPCDQASSNDATACITISKSARNVTKNTESTASLAAAGGDEIVYTLSAKNTGRVTVNGFVVEENISDVLDYATLTNPQGGKLGSNNVIKWDESSIKPGETVERKFTVKIKNPIPTTPVSTSDPGHFDGKLTNVYGNTVTISLPLPPAKQIEITTTTTLPSTGPGESIAAGFAVTVVIAYFFARSRLFATELTIVREEYAYAGEV